ncbi:hypothetical protein GE061_013259 [Apolygus lucorum]|uniref:Phosphatidic acid phosphatase type 2/haloperoxidase domain-containing protein n=1 Tax=Apolygus lucorum TaxID=248454 RepID=A0A8S9XMG8_APOLU|nr:hypothetical protein GE061_013259 [Apolygus lucorum]
MESFLRWNRIDSAPHWIVNMNWIESFKSPYSVLKIQNWFGVLPRQKVVPRHLPNGMQTALSSSDDEDQTYTSSSDSEETEYIVTNKFWYFLFVLGTELGDEIFYASFIPFWFWNIDGAVGRRVVMVWSIIMCIGQGLKDIICWPRPSSPPVYRLQKKWSLEYGMPSTHAMVGVSIPFSVLIYTMQRYEYSVTVGAAVALLWCLVVSVSRLYLGMHTVLDVIAGLFLALILMIPVVPVVDVADRFWLTSRFSPIILLSLSILIIAFYPKSKIWTPTRQDTTMIMSVCVGVHLGAWTNYQLGIMSAPISQPPYVVIWPSYEMCGLLVLRSAIGFSCIVATRALCKSASYATVCFLLRLNQSEVETTAHTAPSSAKNTVELCYKYITTGLQSYIYSC